MENGKAARLIRPLHNQLERQLNLARPVPLTADDADMDFLLKKHPGYAPLPSRTQARFSLVQSAARALNDS